LAIPVAFFDDQGAANDCFFISVCKERTEISGV